MFKLTYAPFATGISIILLVSGCDRAPAPETPAGPAADAQEPSTGADTAALATEDPEGRIRITLNADGTVYKVEGRISPLEGGSPVGDWQGPLKEVDGTDPDSAGEIIATIELRSFESDPEDEAHSHGGGADITAIPHCHEWIYLGTKRKLVHC